MYQTPACDSVSRLRIYNRHGVFDTNRLRLIIYTPLLANKNAYKKG